MGARAQEASWKAFGGGGGGGGLEFLGGGGGGDVGSSAGRGGDIGPLRHPDTVGVACETRAGRPRGGAGTGLVAVHALVPCFSGPGVGCGVPTCRRAIRASLRTILEPSFLGASL